MTQRDGAVIVVRFKCKNMYDHSEPDWEAALREMIEADGIFDYVDDAGEIVSIEKWEYEE